MFWRKRETYGVDKTYDNFLEIIDKIKSGDRGLRDKFINDYKPFVLSCVSKFLNKFVEIENSEEFSIGLIAFDKAIDDYDCTKNSHFLSFADLVIRRRLLNYVKQERKNSNTYPFSYFEAENDSSLEEAMIDKSIHLHFNKFEAREEILIFNKRLEKFGISMDDLVKKTPKHKDSRKMLIEIARIIAQNDVLYQKLMSKLCMPMSDLAPYIRVNPKTVEKNRKYIIAVCLAIRSDLDIIKGFLQNIS